MLKRLSLYPAQTCTNTTKTVCPTSWAYAGKLRTAGTPDHLCHLLPFAYSLYCCCTSPPLPFPWLPSPCFPHFFALNAALAGFSSQAPTEHHQVAQGHGCWAALLIPFFYQNKEKETKQGSLGLCGVLNLAPPPHEMNLFPAALYCLNIEETKEGKLNKGVRDLAGFRTLDHLLIQSTCSWLLCIACILNRMWLQVVAAFKILTSDKQVKALLVNIFGGPSLFKRGSPLLATAPSCSTLKHIPYLYNSNR
jgi:hypothetical protein